MFCQQTSSKSRYIYITYLEKHLHLFVCIHTCMIRLFVETQCNGVYFIILFVFHFCFAFYYFFVPCSRFVNALQLVLKSFALFNFAFTQNSAVEARWKSFLYFLLKRREGLSIIHIMFCCFQKS